MQLIHNIYGEHIIIVGCGDLGSELANKLSENGESVVIIDKNKDAFAKLSPSFGGIFVTGDAAHTEVLYEAGIEKVRVFIAATDSDNLNIMTAQMAKSLFNTKNVIVRLNDAGLSCLLEDLNIKIVCPVNLVIDEITKMI